MASKLRSGTTAWPAALVVSAWLGVVGGAAGAQESGIAIELNRVEAVDGACRIYLYLQNQTSASFTDLQLELVSFDKDGLIGEWLVVDLAPLQAGKRLVKLFDFQNTQCEALDRLLLNSVAACGTEAGAMTDCMDLLEPSSRAAATLLK